MRLQPNIFLRIFMFTAILPLWREFNRVPLDYALVKTFWPSKFGFDSNHSNWAQIHSLTFLQCNGKQTKCGFCKEEGKWKIQLSVGKKLGKKNIRMTSLSYLSLNLLSSRHCWHDTRKQERLWQKNMFSIWHLKKKKKRKCVSFDYSNLRICSKSEFSQEGYKIRTLNMYDCGGKINYLNLFLVFLPLLAIPFFLLFVGNYQNFF